MQDKKGTKKGVKVKNMQKHLNQSINQFNQLLQEIQNMDIQKHGDFTSFIQFVKYSIDEIDNELTNNSELYVANYENDTYYESHEKECDTWHDLSALVANVMFDLTSNDLSKYMNALDYLLIVKPFDLID